MSDIAEITRAAIDGLAAAHRIPTVIRNPEIIAGESALRGARLSMLIDAPSSSSHTSISCYSLLTVPVVSRIASTWLRAPAQVLAQLDVRAGGCGVPEEATAVASIRKLVTSGDGNFGTVLGVHNLIMSTAMFGERSGLIARVAMRLTAVACGVDAVGLAVPEVYLHRNVNEYRANPTNEELLMRAWIAGAEEGAAIARAL